MPHASKTVHLEEKKLCFFCFSVLSDVLPVIYKVTNVNVMLANLDMPCLVAYATDTGTYLSPVLSLSLTYAKGGERVELTCCHLLLMVAMLFYYCDDAFVTVSVRFTDCVHVHIHNN